MFDEFVTFQARQRPRELALITLGRSVTFAELDADVDRLAAGLRGLGVAPRDGVAAIQIAEPYLKHVMLLALTRLGVASSSAHDDAADIRLADDDWGSAPRQIRLSTDWITAILAAEPIPVPRLPRRTDALARVMLRPGPARTPRRLAVTGRMLEENVRNTLGSYAAGKLGAWVTLAGIDTMLGLTTTLAAWSAGAAVVADLSATTLAASLPLLKPSLVALTPTDLGALLLGLPADAALQPDLRLVVAGGPLPPAMALEARLRLGPDVRMIYGAAECSAAAMADAALLEAASGVGGYPVPGVLVEVVDAAGATLPPGVQGQVRLSGDRVAGAYIDAPDDAAGFRDGGFYPGDLGRLLPGGLLVIDGRADGRLNVGGQLFLPEWLDEEAGACPGVADAAAFTVPDTRGLDECWLAVVQGQGFDRARLVDRLARQGGAFPPVRFAWIQGIPRDPAGRVDRHRLRVETLAALDGSAPGVTSP